MSSQKSPSFLFFFLFPYSAAIAALCYLVSGVLLLALFIGLLDYWVCLIGILISYIYMKSFINCVVSPRMGCFNAFFRC